MTLYKLRCENNTLGSGLVYLIGAGPGDPELLTLKAARLIAEADVLLYDRLVHADTVGLASQSCEKIYVGKQCGEHAFSQSAICALLTAKAGAGKTVVRLKGGDPFIFGRGGEECEVLAQAIIPGVTAATACAAYAGIPLTHRETAHSVEFITGQRSDTLSDVKWRDMVSSEKTLVCYMGLKQLPHIVENLISAGMDEHTAFAFIDRGTCETQQVFTTTLGDAVRYSRLCEFSGPTLMIIGNVVDRRQSVSLDLLLPKKQGAISGKAH